jgi:squalene-associated FAD-dependent desaturase
VDDVEVDNGQHVYLACCIEFIDFVKQVERLGGSGRPTLFLQDRFEALLLAPGKPPARLRAIGLPAPLHLAPALLRYGYLDVRARLQIALALLAARRSPGPGETFAAWLDRHRQSPRAREAFWEPFLVPALNAPLEEVSAEAALFVVSTAFLRDADAARFGYSLVPLGHIAQAAARHVDRVHLRAPVARVGTGANTGTGPCQIVLEDGSLVCCDGAVLAVPPSRLMRLLEGQKDLIVDGLEGFRMAPIVDVHLWYERASDDLGLLEGAGFAALLGSPVQWVFEKGPGYLCCSMSAAGEYVGRPSSELVELCRAQLALVLPALRHARLLRGAATRDRDATFVPAPGLRRPGPATACPQVVIAGAWTDTGWPATMESAVRSGRSAARVLASQIG